MTGSRENAPVGSLDPGTIRVPALAVHWAVCETTARVIIAAANLPNVSLSGWSKHRWLDVWRLEGAGFVPPCDWAAFRARLIPVSELSGLDIEGRSARTWRRHVASGRMPSIRLSPDVRRVRECTFHSMAAHV